MRDNLTNKLLRSKFSKSDYAIASRQITSQIKAKFTKLSK